MSTVDVFPLSPGERAAVEAAQRALVGLLRVAPPIAARHPAALQRDQLRRQIRAVCDWCTLALGPDTTAAPAAPAALFDEFAPARSPHGAGVVVGGGGVPAPAAPHDTPDHRASKD